MEWSFFFGRKTLSKKEKKGEEPDGGERKTLFPLPGEISPTPADRKGSGNLQENKKKRTNSLGTL